MVTDIISLQEALDDALVHLTDDILVLIGDPGKAPVELIANAKARVPPIAIQAIKLINNERLGAGGLMALFNAGKALFDVHQAPYTSLLTSYIQNDVRRSYGRGWTQIRERFLTNPQGGYMLRPAGTVFFASVLRGDEQTIVKMVETLQIPEVKIQSVLAPYTDRITNHQSFISLLDQIA
jgi:hypothetical protein